MCTSRVYALGHDAGTLSFANPRGGRYPELIFDVGLQSLRLECCVLAWYSLLSVIDFLTSIYTSVKHMYYYMMFF